MLIKQISFSFECLLHIRFSFPELIPSYNLLCQLYLRIRLKSSVLCSAGYTVMSLNIILQLSLDTQYLSQVFSIHLKSIMALIPSSVHLKNVRFMDFVNGKSVNNYRFEMKCHRLFRPQISKVKTNIVVQLVSYHIMLSEDVSGYRLNNAIDSVL